MLIFFCLYNLINFYSEKENEDLKKIIQKCSKIFLVFLNSDILLMILRNTHGDDDNKCKVKIDRSRLT